MGKNKFIEILQKRAQEQQIINNVPFHKLFIFLSTLLGENPWRIILPIAFICTVSLQLVLGKVFDEYILFIFGNI